MTDTPDIATHQPQDPNVSHCSLGWSSCTCFSQAMALDVVFFGTRIPTGCQIRSYTGDTSGGTSIPQVADVALAHYGVTMEQHVGGGVCSPAYALGQLTRGRGFILQGNAGATLGTPQQSTSGYVNHAIWVEDRQGGTTSAPQQVLVDDPARGVGKGPQWWPTSLLLKFAAALKPSSTDGGKTGAALGSGKFYCALVPPPRVHFTHAGSPTTPFPDYQTIAVPIPGRSANVRSGPTMASPIVSRLATGTRFVAYQTAIGDVPDGSSSSRWYGDWTGTRWIHSSNLSGFGGLQARRATMVDGSRRVGEGPKGVLDGLPDSVPDGVVEPFDQP